MIPLPLSSPNKKIPSLTLKNGIPSDILPIKRERYANAVRNAPVYMEE
jgi:hypothetical protein